MRQPPPSLRVYAIAKAAPALLDGFNVLAQHHELLGEVEAYVEAERRVEAARAREEEARLRHMSKGRP